MPGLGDDVENEMTGILAIDRKRDAAKKSKKKGIIYYMTLVGGVGIVIIIVALIIMSSLPAPEPPPPPPPAEPTLMSVALYTVSSAHDQRVFQISYDSGPEIFKNISDVLFVIYGPEESGLPTTYAQYDPLLFREAFEPGDVVYIYQTLRNGYMVTGTPPQYSQFTDLANGAWKVITMSKKTSAGFGEMGAKLSGSKTHYVTDGSIRSAIEGAQWYDTVIVSGPEYKERLSIEKPLRLYSFNNSVIDGGNLNTVIIVKSNNVEIAGFEIKNSGNKGFSDGAIVIYQDFSGASIYNNVVHHGAVGIWLWGAKDNVINNNIIYKNDKEGILLQNAADHNTITNNRVEDNTGDGIVIEASDFNKVTENYVSGNNGGYGIIISDYSVLHNTCEYNTGDDRMYCNDEADRVEITPRETPVVHTSLEDDLKNFRVWVDGPGPSK